jgi:hypothetical protein
MSIQKINGGAYKNVDEESLGSESAELIDGYVDELNNTSKRPGLVKWVDIGTGRRIDAIYPEYKHQVFLAISNKRVHTISFDGVISGLDSAISASDTYPSIFASNGAKVWIAGGTGKLINYDGTATYVADALAPATSTHVAYMENYIIANDLGDNKFYWTDPTDADIWPAASYASLATNPGPIVALHNYYNQLMLFGPHVTEVWTLDGTNPFSPVLGSTLQCGCSAPYSIVVAGGVLFWLDDKRRFVYYSGSASVSISGAVHRLIQGLTKVSDAVAWEMSIAGQNFIILNFPYSNLTLAYNYMTKQWQRWGSYNSTTDSYNMFMAYSGASNIYTINQNTLTAYKSSVICGDNTNGLIYRASPDIFTDNGAIIRTLRRTGNITHDTHYRKRVNSLTIRAKVKSDIDSSMAAEPWLNAIGTWAEQTQTWAEFSQVLLSALTGTQRFKIRWKDDGGDWKEWHSLYIDGRNRTRTLVKLFRLGIYRTRQYEIVHDDNTSFVFIEAEENAEILTS